MKKTKLIIYCVCISFFSSIVFGQANYISNENSKIAGCIAKHFPPIRIIEPNEDGTFEMVFCDKPSRQLCAISYGISHGNFDGVKCLVNAGYNFNVKSEKYTRKDIPIMNAAYYDNEMLKLIFKSKIPIEIEVKDKYGQTTLQFLNSSFSSKLINRGPKFSWERIEKSVAFLLKKGANPDVSFNGITPLMSQASRGGKAKYIALFLQYNANPDFQSTYGKTALMMSADDPDIIKLLLDANANIYLRDKNGNSAIFHAIENCEINKIKALLKKDETILESLNNKGVTALKYLEGRRSSKKCLELNTLTSVRDR